jgi:lysozyme
MRLSGFSAILLACVALTGCTSSTGVSEVLSPSQEMTSSVARPVPPASVGDIIAQTASLPAHALAAPAPLPPAAVALAKESRTLAMPVPELQQAALVVPSNPARTRSRVYAHNFRDAKPINFGKARSPRNHAVHGVDVSRWQANIDWPKLRSQGANFVYIKATDGGDHLDPMFRKNWRDAHEAGLKRGAYHFFYWCRTAGEQADWFIRNVPKVEGALPPVIDVEYNGESKCQRRLSPAKVREKMQVFMDKLERHYGQRPVIYTAPDFYRDNLRGAFLDYPFWLRAVAEHPSKVYPGREWVFWQYSGTGLSHGVSGKIDLNVFHGNENEWHRWLDAKTYRGNSVVARADRTQ